MEKDIMLIMSLTGCNNDTAKQAYEEKNHDVLLAIDYILFGNVPPPASKKRKRDDENEHEAYLNSMRKKMEEMDAEIQNHKSTTSNPLDCEESNETLDRHEEMAQQNSCFQECQIPSMEGVVETQETAYPLHPEYSFYSR